MGSSTAKSEKTRDRILRAAAELFAARGLDGVSVREIVRQAEVNLGAVTYHFGGKEELFAKVLDHKLSPMMAMGREILDSGLDAKAKLREMLRAYARYVLCVDPGLRVLFVALLNQGSDVPAVVEQSLEWRNRAFGEVYRAGVKAGELRECDVEEAAWCFFGMLTPYILYQPVGGVGRWREKDALAVADKAADFFLHGIVLPDGKGSASNRKGKRQ